MEYFVGQLTLSQPQIAALDAWLDACLAADRAPGHIVIAALDFKKSQLRVMAMGPSIGKKMNELLISQLQANTKDDTGEIHVASPDPIQDRRDAWLKATEKK